MKGQFLIALLLCACGKQAVPRDQEPAARIEERATVPSPRAVSVDEETDLIEFHFSWPAEAAAIPELDRRFRAEMAKARAEIVASAQEDRDYRKQQGFDFHGHMSSTDYQTAGQTDRLLSLSVEQGSYTGGAHGNAGVGSLLWDRPARQVLEVSGLFSAANNLDRLMTQRWCDALNVAREQKRGEPVGGGGLFDDCPKLEEIAIIPVDGNRNGRFELLKLVASPYVAGPWAEGSYEVELPVTADLMSALKDEYRGSFEAPQTQ